MKIIFERTIYYKRCFLQQPTMPVMTSWSKTQEPPNPLTVGILQILCVHICYYIFNPELLEYNHRMKVISSGFNFTH